MTIDNFREGESFYLYQLFKYQRKVFETIKQTKKKISYLAQRYN